MTDWQKIPDAPDAPHWLEIRKGRYKTSYRVNYRAEGLDLRKKLKGDFKNWKQARLAGEQVIGEAKYGIKEKPKSQIRCEDLCAEILKLAESKASATYALTALFLNKHLTPYLNDHCPYAADLNPTVWLNYKHALRVKNPTVSLFNHCKFFRMLCRYAFEKGILPAPIKIDFDEKREDFRAEGHVIPDADFAKMLAHAKPNWKDRLILQRRTGMRPGEVRHLKKDRLKPASGGFIVSLRKEDTKTRQARSFLVTAADAVELLARRLAASPGSYLFPSEADSSKPVGRHLESWQTILKHADVNPDYTPHDLRHSYATDMFKRTSNHVTLCYQLGMSLQEAQRTYIHNRLEDTAEIAEIAKKDKSSKALNE
jgi:integrase